MRLVWARTAAGHLEIRTRALITERAQRYLLLAIDGVSSEVVLQASLASLTEISPAHFQMLKSLHLIAPVVAPSAFPKMGKTAPPNETRPLTQRARGCASRRRGRQRGVQRLRRATTPSTPRPAIIKA